MPRRLTLIAGSGDLAPLVAAATDRNGDSLQIIDLLGRGDLRGGVVRRIPVSDAAAIVAAIRDFHTTDLVAAGGIALSDSDRHGIAASLGLAGRLAGSMGDTALALAYFAYFRLAGIRTLGAHEIIADLLAEEGHIAGPATDADGAALAALALAAARAVGRLDLGQAIVMSGRRAVAAEDAGGTDALLERVAALRTKGVIGDGNGLLILAKALKPGQPKFVDLPTIGPKTIVGAAAAGINIVAIEAGQSLVLDREELRREAQSRGVAVIGLKPRRG